MRMHLLQKTELYFSGVRLRSANLDEVARVVAGILGLAPSEVFVVDVREDCLTLDILRDTVELEHIGGKEGRLLEALGSLEGVTCAQGAQVHSEGILGLVSLDAERAAGLPAKLQAMERDIVSHVSRKAIVFPTGHELIAGDIEDTNTPMLVELLSAFGYEVHRGRPLDDDLDLLIGALGGAAETGYGLVVTTGGTGAEDKDHVVEAIQALDPGAATPYVVRYQAGQGRHRKDGVRLAVGQWGWTTFVALTGPNREVSQVAPTLLQGLGERWEKMHLAEEMARVLRAGLRPHRTSH